MRLSLQQKEQLFYELSSGISAGLSFRDVLLRGAERRSRLRRQVAREMLAAMEGGDATAESAFAGCPGTFDSLDLALVRAGEASGQLAEIFKSLADYYRLIDKARRGILNQLAYPVFLLHFGIVILAAPGLVADGLNAFLWQVGISLGILYAGIILIALVIFGLIRTLQSRAWLERLIRLIPIFGGVRQALVSARFSAVLAMLIQAGSGILTAFQQAGDASGSRLFAVGAHRVVEMVRGGEPLATAAIESRCFPEEIRDGIQTAETNGRLDVEMHRVSAIYQERFSRKLDALAAWLPRMIYLIVLIVLAIKIIQFAQGYFQTIDSLLQ